MRQRESESPSNETQNGDTKGPPFYITQKDYLVYYGITQKYMSYRDTAYLKMLHIIDPNAYNHYFYNFFVTPQKY